MAIVISILQKSCQIGCLCRIFVNHNDMLSYISRENCGFGDFRIWKLRSDYMGIPHRQDVLDLIHQVRKQ